MGTEWLEQFDLEAFNIRQPVQLDGLLKATEDIGFDMRCADRVGNLLRLLASTKTGGRILEIGTGTGVGAAWLLSGMDSESTLLSIELDKAVLDVAREHLGDDPRVTFVNANAGDVIKRDHLRGFDLIFADAYPGKYELLAETIGMLNPGGIYVVDDMLPQDDWPAEHYPIATEMFQGLTEFCQRSDVNSVGLHWDTGLVILTLQSEKKAAEQQ